MVKVFGKFTRPDSALAYYEKAISKNLQGLNNPVLAWGGLPKYWCNP